MPKAIEDQAFRRLPNLQLPPDLPIKDTLNKAAEARPSHIGLLYIYKIKIYIYIYIVAANLIFEARVAKESNVDW